MLCRMPWICVVAAVGLLLAASTNATFDPKRVRYIDRALSAGRRCGVATCWAYLCPCLTVVLLCCAFFLLPSLACFLFLSLIPSCSVLSSPSLSCSPLLSLPCPSTHSTHIQCSPLTLLIEKIGARHYKPRLLLSILRRPIGAASSHHPSACLSLSHDQHFTHLAPKMPTRTSFSSSSFPTRWHPLQLSFPRKPARDGRPQICGWRAECHTQHYRPFPRCARL